MMDFSMALGAYHQRSSPQFDHSLNPSRFLPVLPVAFDIHQLADVMHFTFHRCPT
jgi:hypothetical protein